MFPRKAHTEAERTVHPSCSLSSPFPSDSESKTSIVKVIRSILRENFRRHIKCELPLEKTCKDRLVPLKNRVPVSAKLGENFISSVLMKKTCPLPQSSHSSIKHTDFNHIPSFISWHDVMQAYHLICFFLGDERGSGGFALPGLLEVNT